MRTLLAFHQDHCLACRNCELACSVVHSSSGRLETAISEQVPPRRRLTMAAGKDGVEAHRCEQCLEPLCAFSCKSGALSRDPASGQVVFDESRCLACYMCFMVCPFGIRPDPAADLIVRCDLCRDREPPACVEACPTGALGTKTEPDRRVQSEFEGHVVVVGSSAAGIAACEAAREHAPRCSITLVTADEHPQYSRPLLAYFLAGQIPREDLAWRADDYLDRDLKVRVLEGLRSLKLKADTKTLALDDGTELSFDRLILATGARGITLSIAGAALDGVYGLRNLDDLDGIERRIEPGKRAVVLGGGNVGLQACEALQSRGMNVSVVVSSPYLLSQMVDAEAGRRVVGIFTRHGVEVRTGCDAIEIVGDGCVQGVRLNSSEVMEANLVIVGKGIKPNVEWLRESGIRIGRGIEVDTCGRTSLPDVFAAGDCAELPDPLTGKLAVSGIWPVAYEMGRAAGSTAVGVEKASAGALRLNASRFFGDSIISIGEVCPERLAGSSARVLENRDGVYRKLVHYRGRLAGALLFGDISDAGVFYRLYREGKDLGDQFANHDMRKTPVPVTTIGA